MKLAGATAAAAALLAAGPAAAEPPSRADIFCAELLRTVEVAELDGDFTYLERSRAAPPRLGFRKCFAAASARPAWHCHQTMAPDHLSVDALAERTGACLPAAERTLSGDDEAVFTLPRARIRITGSGGPRAHVGRIVTYRVETLEREQAQ